MAIEPDTKDWTWVLERPCPECGLDVSMIPGSFVPSVIRSSTARWRAALERPDAATRPDSSTWSALEYAAHVADVHAVFADRFTMVLEQDDPQFENWDQDETARAERYGEQDPAEVATRLAERAERAASVLDGVPGRAWERPGRRSNGSAFTLETLARYYLHDVSHHLWDVRA